MKHAPCQLHVRRLCAHTYCLVCGLLSGSLADHANGQTARLCAMLQVCADTLIGDDQIRGVSGGQRKRVTTGQLSLLPGMNHTLFGKTCLCL